MEAIILAGGFGTRLKTAVADLPKSMACVNRQPFLNYILNFLIKNEIRRAALATGYLHHKIEAHYGGLYKDLQIVYSVENEPLGTGGAIKQALSLLTSDRILIINGDTFFDVAVDELMQVHRRNRAVLTIALKPLHRISRYGSVEIEGTKVKCFEEKSKRGFGYINGGVYMANHSLFESYDLPRRFSFEEAFLKKFTSQLNIHAYVSDAYFIDIGIPEDYQRAQTEMGEYE